MTNHPKPFGNNIAEIKQGAVCKTKTDTVYEQISFLITGQVFQTLFS